VAQHAVELPAAIRRELPLSDDSVARFGYARFLMPTSNVRDTLGDFVNQYSGYAQTTTTLDWPTAFRSSRCRIRSRGLEPGHRAVRPVVRPLHELGGAVSLDQYELRPQINDRFNGSYQKEMLGPSSGRDATSSISARACPYDINLNMWTRRSSTSRRRC
jgi:hypothetical protein